MKQVVEERGWLKEVFEQNKRDIQDLPSWLKRGTGAEATEGRSQTEQQKSKSPETQPIKKR